MGTRGCSCVRVRSRAGADDAPIRGSCASETRSLRKAIHRWNTHTYNIYIHTMHACLYIHARLATPTNGSPMRSRRTHARTCCVRARACACAFGRPRIRTDSCERVPSAWTAGGSARRRSSRRRRSTPTSARGTLPRSPRCPWYAPPFRPGRRATAGGTRSAGRRCGAGRCARRDRRRCARVCADVWARACAGVPVCKYSCAYERRDI